MSLRFVCLVLLLISTTVPRSVGAQHLPAFLRVRASDVVDVPSGPNQQADRTEVGSRQQVKAAQLMAWGAGISASLLPYAVVARLMARGCYDQEVNPRLRTQFIMYGVLGSAGLALAATGFARWRRLPEGFTAAHPLARKERRRAKIMSVVALTSSLVFMSLLTYPEMDVCGSS